ncbi:MAG: MoaD/ThiS family protein [Planctomycetota bacterium]
MSIRVHVPQELRRYCGGVAQVEFEVQTVRAALLELERAHPDVYRGVCDETGAVRRHINLFVNVLHIRDRDGLDTALAPGDALIILPAVSGG